MYAILINISSLGSRNDRHSIIENAETLNRRRLTVLLFSLHFVTVFDGLLLLEVLRILLHKNPIIQHDKTNNISLVDGKT